MAKFLVTLEFTIDTEDYNIEPNEESVEYCAAMILEHDFKLRHAEGVTLKAKPFAIPE
jgi:hypothetical protein